MKESIILTDCDGVLVDWEAKFTEWMIRQGYAVINDRAYSVGERFGKNRYGISKEVSRELIKYFNESAAIETLRPFRDAIKYVRRLHEEHGFVFHVITSLSTDTDAGRLRKRNLELLFGATVFEKIVCLECGADKDEALETYRDSECFWVEDKPENADTGTRMGLRSILLEHSHNMSYNGPAKLLKNWKDIYSYITGDL